MLYSKPLSKIRKEKVMHKSTQWKIGTQPPSIQTHLKIQQASDIQYLTSLKDYNSDLATRSKRTMDCRRERAKEIAEQKELYLFIATNQLPTKRKKHEAGYRKNKKFD